MLTDKQKQKIIDTVEEELADMEKYSTLERTQAAAINTGGFQIQIVVVDDESDEYMDFDEEE